jgi:putative addiction module component (TIGR02574 family)
MSPLEQVLEQALRLSLADQLKLADRLEETIQTAMPGPPPGMLDVDSPKLLDELERRMANYLADPSTALPYEEVMAELRRRQDAGL